MTRFNEQRIFNSYLSLSKEGRVGVNPNVAIMSTLNLEFAAWVDVPLFDIPNYALKITN